MARPASCPAPTTGKEQPGSLWDRLIRLGIPLAFFSWVINPLFLYVVQVVSQDLNMPLWEYFPGEYFKTEPLIGAGPLLFVEVLLIFSLVYIVWRLLVRPRPSNPAVTNRFPGDAAIAMLALLLGIASFLLRLAFAIDYTFKPLNLQFPFFTQYIALFVVGLIAYRRNWLITLPDKTGRLWLGIAGLLIVPRIPMMLALGAVKDDALVKGGWHWQALVYALWESFVAMGMCLGLIYVFRRCLNRRGKVAGFLVPNAYTAYIIHAPVITLLALAARDISAYPLVKWFLVALVAVTLCFGLSSLVRKLPAAHG